MDNIFLLLTVIKQNGDRYKVFDKKTGECIECKRGQLNEVIGRIHDYTIRTKKGEINERK